MPRRWLQRALVAATLALSGALAGAALAQDGATEVDSIPRHALELQALVAPEQVLAELPAALAASRDAGDLATVALLHLAEANACRVIADWLCQRRAAAAAADAAQQAGAGILLARGKILESRALIGLQDYNRAEQLLSEAQAQLARTPLLALSADVQLGFSSLSHAVGKHQLAAEYAARGLQLLGADDAPGMQARLQRNRARALAQLGDSASAQLALDAGIAASLRVEDPKLTAELHLESARLANRLGDVEAQRRHSDQVLELADQLSNSQLYGQAHEALALAAVQAGQAALAEKYLDAASRSFRSLGLKRDELRANQALISLQLDQRTGEDPLGKPLRRLFTLQEEVARNDRAQAADDFENRLEYAQQQLEILRLEADARLAEERSRALDAQTRLSQWVTRASLAAVLVLAIFYAAQLRAKRRLMRVLADLRRSESRASELLRLSKGLVLLHDLDGRIDLLNPAAAQALLVPSDSPVLGSLGDHVANADHEALHDYLLTLRQRGEASAVLQVTPRGGEPRTLRIDGRVALGDARRPYVIGNAADITEETREAEVLRGQTMQDPLTGCFNRRYLEAFAADTATGSQWAVINIDLDGFKQINDSHGHEHGDGVLRAIAGFLQQRLREDDALVRTGGDEFLILLPRATPASLGALVARLETDRDVAPCRYSLGSASREDGESLTDTMARADARMYELRRRARAGRSPNEN
jgi:diguanylate cyclase (GGDEF)-like protein